MAIKLKDASLLPTDLVVFYCWQDHLEKKCNRFLIRDSVKGAIKRVQAELPSGTKCTLRFDSDTANTSGSVEIVNAILEKIRGSSIVVADVTPVLVNKGKGRYYPNPNVMMELGYAARSIGWNRIINVFNSAYATPKQLPFDFTHRRVTPYRCKDVSDAKAQAKGLEDTMYDAIVAVIQGMAKGEADPSLGDNAIRRQRDVQRLTNVLGVLNTSDIQYFIEKGMHQGMYVDVADWYFEGFRTTVTQPGFKFYDKKLSALINELLGHWVATNDATGLLFSPGLVSPGSYSMQPRHLWGEAGEHAYEQMNTSYQGMDRVYREFLDYVHEHYTELDEREMSRKARKERLADEAAMRKAMNIK